MKKIIYILLTLAIFLPTKAFAGDIGLTVTVEKVSGYENVYTTKLTFKIPANFSTAKLKRDGQDIVYGGGKRYTDSQTGLEMMQISDPAPDPGVHSYHVELYDSANQSLGGQTLPVEVSADSAKTENATPEAKTTTPVTNQTTKTEFGNANNIGDYLSLIMKWAYPIVGGLAVMMLIFAGYKYITSQGNPETIGQAKELIIGVFIGIAILFLIRLLLVNVIGTLSG